MLDLARHAIRAALSPKWAAHPTPPSAQPPVALPPIAGCFVSLHDRRTHALRGCVGQMQATGSTQQMIERTAVHTLGDPRFAGARAVREAELPELEIEISLLTPLRPASTPLDFDPASDGIHVSIDGRTGVFLPQVARDTGWTREQLLDRLCTEKMGLPPRAWQSPAARLQTFQTVIVGPAPFQPETD